MNTLDEPGVETGRLVLARALPEAAGTSDHPVHLVALPLDEVRGEVSALCGRGMRPGEIETMPPGEEVRCTLCFTVHVTGEPASDIAGEASTSARVAAALAYRELGWPVTLRGEQVSLNLDLDLDAVALVIPVVLAAQVAEILTRRHCPPPVLAHPALPTHRVILAGERYPVALAWPAGVHRVTGTVVLPPTVTAHGPVRWVRPPQPHALKLCREFDVCAALCAASPEPPPSSPSHF
ncbi:MAG: hypothetical protein ACRDTE_14975 [Pseudonocardiaceae bacterium]